jgi:hypothetical protein
MNSCSSSEGTVASPDHKVLDLNRQSTSSHIYCKRCKSTRTRGQVPHWGKSTRTRGKYSTGSSLPAPEASTCTALGQVYPHQKQVQHWGGVYLDQGASTALRRSLPAPEASTALGGVYPHQRQIQHWRSLPAPKASTALGQVYPHQRQVQHWGKSTRTRGKYSTGASLPAPEASTALGRSLPAPGGKSTRTR